MSTYKSWVPYNEYRKRRRAVRKAQEQERAKEAEKERQFKLAWAEQSRKLTQAQQEHPVAYFFGTTDAQREHHQKIWSGSLTSCTKEVNEDSNSDRWFTGVMGWFTSLLLLLVFFPLLLLSHPRQLPVLQIISFVALGIEYYRYKKGTAFQHEWKVVLGVLTVLGWIFFLSLRSH